MIILIDCNNFFVSCERLFRPDLNTIPVVVLSSNDGCVVARSNEAKSLGIPMGAPVFKFRDIFDHNDVIQFSASFELYGNISRRITNLLSELTPNIEVYSIDESFLDITELGIANYIQWAKAIRQRVLQEIGVPVSIGVAPTKTLAKLASEIAKQQPMFGGVYSFADDTPDTHQQALAMVPVKDIWGVGRKLAPKLRAEGIHNAYQLSQVPPKRAQQLLNITGRQMVAELNGIPCFPLAPVGKAQKSIMRGRTFGEDTGELHAIESVIATMVTQAAFRLRHQNQVAHRASIVIENNRHKPGYQRWYREVVFATPTHDTGEIITNILRLFSDIQEPGQKYHRLNVFLSDLSPIGNLQTDILGAVDVSQYDRSTARMQALDGINNRFGRHHLYYASEDLNKTWQPRRKLTTPRYVSEWADIPVARIVQ
jgi:DNA polymerase V